GAFVLRRIKLHTKSDLCIHIPYDKVKRSERYGENLGCGYFNDRKICGRQLVSLSAGGRLSGASFSRMEAKGEQILAGSYRRLCLSLSLSGYGRDHYKIFHWPVCILADDVAASDGGDVRLRGSVFPWLIPEAV